MLSLAVERLSFTLTLLWLSLCTQVLAGRSNPTTCPARRHPPGSSDTGKQVYALATSNGTSYISLDGGVSVSVSASASSQKSCFPALDFQMPSQLPADNSDWWCEDSTEYAFLGFSYGITGCQSLSQLRKEFKDIRQRFKGRYVRLYGTCDKPGFYDNVIEAAYENTLGIHALIWFGFDGGDAWKSRRDSLFNTLHTNPKAPFVTRVVQFGTEPLYDNVISAADLAHEIISAKAELASLGIPITISELAYGYKERGAAADAVLAAVDSLNIHILPFFETEATSGAAAWPLVMEDLSWFIENGNGKKMYLDQTGWPSVTSPGVHANSGAAVAAVWSEKQYFDLLDKNCAFFKTAPGGGVGWFAHMYSDSQGPGYGILDTSGNPKFAFSPKTSC